jgi:hypothetical protein
LLVLAELVVSAGTLEDCELLLDTNFLLLGASWSLKSSLVGGRRLAAF